MHSQAKLLAVGLVIFPNLGGLSTNPLNDMKNTTKNTKLFQNHIDRNLFLMSICLRLENSQS